MQKKKNEIREKEKLLPYHLFGIKFLLSILAAKLAISSRNPLLNHQLKNNTPSE
jgi:hypothetical protein